MATAATSASPSRRVRDGLLAGTMAALAGLAVWNAANRLGPAAAPGLTAARAAVARDPLDTAALSSLGLALAAAGRPREADAALSFVVRRTWRDIPALLWLIPRRIGEGDVVFAMDAVDAVLRRDIDNDLRERLIRLALAAAGDDVARPALVARLALNPWWRAGVTLRLAETGALPGVRFTLLALARGPAPANGAEIAPYIRRLVDGGDYAGALADWRALHPGAASGAALLRDGDFTGPPDPTAFGWRKAQGVGVDSAVEAAPGGGLGLRLDYDGFSSPTLPRQLLVLAPGRYRLSWREWREREAPRLLDWSLVCADGGAVVSATDPAPAGGGWTAVTRAVVVPDTGCKAQWLTLVARPDEHVRPASLWYAHMAIAPAG